MSQKREKNEDIFRDRVIEELQKNKVSIFNLQRGVFDAFLEDYCTFVEFKILKYQPVYYEYLIELHESQTSLLRIMKRKPYILVKKMGGRRYYIFNPGATKKMVIEFEEGERENKRKLPEFWHSEYRFEDQGALKFSNIKDFVRSFIKDLKK